MLVDVPSRSPGLVVLPSTHTYFLRLQLAFKLLQLLRHLLKLFDLFSQLGGVGHDDACGSALRASQNQGRWSALPSVIFHGVLPRC